jgi:hypothetical protein
MLPRSDSLLLVMKSSKDRSRNRRMERRFEILRNDLWKRSFLIGLTHHVLFAFSFSSVDFYTFWTSDLHGQMMWLTIHLRCLKVSDRVVRSLLLLILPPSPPPPPSFKMNTSMILWEVLEVPMPSLEFSLFRSSCRSRISLFLDICHLSLRVGHGPYTACFSIRFRISTSTKTFVVSPKSGTLQGDRPPLCHYHHPLWSYTWRRAHQSFPFKLKPLQ